MVDQMDGRTGFRLMQHVLQDMAKWTIIALAIAASVSTALSFAGLWPWLGMQVEIHGGETVQVGPYVQTGLTILLLSLCAFLPGVNRMLDLERSHRSFAVSMQDVAQAYRLSHATDRDSAFALSSEFDSVRARLHHLRAHPDLASLEPEVMELAAQMSHTTRDLAQIYSDEKVTRAKVFLTERQQDLEAFQDKLDLALSITEELKRWQRDIEASEREANRHMDRLERDLKEVLPGLGYELDDLDMADDDGKVVSMPKSAMSTPDRTN
ncbi:DNA repair protein [Celeribacter baekdonensis]|uniref:DNA repair protein n=1 Tax=Celeribacter baekdonensis TaxID=875171 RepID=A0A2R4M394_9RHOB|nr:DNA repair protein [Celeribacter baekdonensis]AVW91579.1 DNA repair protein [Celeribacter baekdonensis]